MRRDEPLRNWLDAATTGLSEPSKRRIEHEITEHYRSACDAGLGREEALRSLGDPQSARREFRRAYLTSFQEGLVKDYRGVPARWRLVVYGSLLLLGCGVAAWLPETPAQRTFGLAMVLILTAALASLCVLVPRFYRRGRERIAILLGAVSDWAFYVSLIVGSGLVLGDLSPVKVAFFVAVLGLLLILYVPLLRKLSRRGPGTPRTG